MKAKYLRIERKRQKLLKLGLTEEEMAKKLVEKKKYPVTKTLEDYLDETSSKNKVHNLKVRIILMTFNEFILLNLNSQYIKAYLV